MCLVDTSLGAYLSENNGKQAEFPNEEVVMGV